MRTVLVIQWNTRRIRGEIRELGDVLKRRQRMKKRWLFQNRRVQAIGLVLILLGVSPVLPEGLLKIPLYLRDKVIQVEVAKTPEERAQGLMGRKRLGQSEGMLFIFDTEDYHSFWMKNTLIALSIAFIDKEGRIVTIADMKPLTLDSHAPSKPVLYALEMNRGWFSANGIKAGDTVRFSK